MDQPPPGRAPKPTLRAERVRALRWLGLALPLSIAAGRVLLTDPADWLMRWDDGFYYRNAVGLWAGHLPPSDWSPGLAVLMMPIANPWVGMDAALMATRLVLTLAATWLTFVACSRIVVDPIPAAAALLVALSPIPAVYSVGRPAVAAVLAAALAVAGNTPRRAGLALGVLAFGTLVRPEFPIATVVAAVCLLPFLKADLRWYLPAATALAVLLIYSLLVPRFIDSRLLWAFGQHYALTAREQGSWDGNNWHAYGEVLTRDFGNVSSFAQAVRSNPRAVLAHIRHNAAIVPREAALALTGGSRTRHRVLVFGLAFLLLVGAVRGFRVDPERARAVLAAALPQLAVVAGGIAIVPLFLLIRPSADHLFVLLPAVAVLASTSVAMAVRNAWRDAEPGAPTLEPYAEPTATPRADREPRDGAITRPDAQGTSRLRRSMVCTFHRP